MSLKIYNTLTKKQEEFIPNENGTVKMYTCGPTVYHFAHIGNLRSYIMEDVLQCTLEYLGYSVDRCMNITDVGHLSGDSDYGDDKMLSGAKREHKTVLEIAEMYTNAFKEDCKSLNIAWPNKVVPATTCIDEYIKIITKLLETGFAYISGGNVYFDVSKLKNYYILSNQNAENLEVGVRDSVEKDELKRNQNDFALWFTKSKFDDQELKWDSPWGVGYPGWHIECSAISLKYLGEKIDIHCGGVDNIFPHHTNEIAQSESYLGHKWCNYWFHVQHLNTELGKMSKSDGEFTTVSTLVSKGYNPLVYRLFCLQSHYRKPLVFSYDRFEGAVSTYKKLKNKTLSLLNNATGDIQNDLINEYKTKFANSLSDDINTALALSYLYDVIKDERLTNNTKLHLIEDFDKVFKLDLLKQEENTIDADFEKYILAKIEERKIAKQNKDYTLADSIRAELLEKGVTLKDTSAGTTYTIN